MGWFSSLFDKSIELEFRDELGHLVKKRVSKKQFDALMNKAVAEGKATFHEACDVHILDPKGSREEQWLIGTDIEKDVYDRFKDNNGHIYAFVVWEKGEPNMSIIKKEIWQQFKMAIGE